MLINFKTRNYKSFIDDTEFSLTAAPKQKGLDYSVKSSKIKGKSIKTLSSSVIYGPNASGKTNIIGAMDTFRSIVLRGNINNSEEKSSPNMASNVLELIPNVSSNSEEPTLFSIEFLEEGMLIKYTLEILLGGFLSSETDRKVLSEELYVNSELIFRRASDLCIGNLKPIQSYVANNDKHLIEIAKNSLNEKELFLTNGFKLIFSQPFVKLITDWFSNKFMVIYKADSLQLIKRFVDPKQKTIYIEKTTNDAAKVFGINSNDLGYVASQDDSETQLCSIFTNIISKKNAAIAADIFESYGTIRFINIFPLVIRAILTGSTLIVDEFDASIHPMALMNIINIFHNDDINIKNAQLVFNTHNPIFLNSNLFRRDEIKFVERNDDTGNSELYSLSDFGTSGENGVRKNEDYMKNYFVSRYGAIKDIDFTPIFEELIKEEA